MNGEADATFPGISSVDLKSTRVEAGTAGTGVDFCLDPGDTEAGN
jgi:hypothetical protein